MRNVQSFTYVHAEQSEWRYLKWVHNTVEEEEEEVIVVVLSLRRIDAAALPVVCLSVGM